MIKALVVFGSLRGNTKLVANRLVEYATFPADVVNVTDLHDTKTIQSYDLVLFLASTWGDGELQIDMENFFIQHSVDLTGKYYGICELGNYYGYDDFEFGALRIMENILSRSNGIEIIEPFCMDSLPKKDWLGFERWMRVLNQQVDKLYA